MTESLTADAPEVGPRFRDGTPFELGMRVVLDNGGEMVTSADEHEVETFVHHGSTRHTLSRKGSRCGIDLNLLHASQAARQVALLAHVNHLRAELDRVAAEVAAGDLTVYDLVYSVFRDGAVG